MSVQILAPAKLTLRLKITGLRSDGYHLIDAEMVSLDLCDLIEITPHSHGASRITVTGPFAKGVPTDSSNLVHQALQLVGRSAEVRIHKVIPHGGGLGGGSSNAAAILRWAGFDDLAAAAGIGADVAYCTVGGRALVGGIGEIVTSLPHRPATFTLVIPPLAVSTPAAYRAYDQLIETEPEITRGYVNDLEPAALHVVPEMAHWKSKITEASGVTPTLAGSGATWFVHGDHADALKPLEQNGAVVRAVQTLEQS
jgi:4-diphosphocytidyl-2-C-methyl-D-erythritol kinase